MLKDFLGRAFVAGQTIVYPGRHSSSLWMNKAQVIAVNPGGKNDLVVRPDRAKRNVRLTELNRVVIVPDVKAIAHVLRTADAGANNISVSPNAGHSISLDEYVANLEGSDELHPGTRLDA
jgi:hypothetical protein